MKAINLGSAALLGLLLASCGGGGGGSSREAGPTTTVGTVSGFGSVFVNGVEFETTGARIVMDDNPNATEDDLRIGMVVKVEGRVNDDGITGKADRILFDADLDGPVTSVADVASGRLEILGQAVLLDDLTAFERTSAATLAPGNIVEVSGFRDAEGNLRARLVELKAEDFEALIEKEIELKGEIRDLSAQNFAIGGLTVDFSGARLQGVLADGVFVEVKSNQDLTPDGVLMASEVEVVDPRIAGAAGLRVELEGMVTALAPPDAIEVNGHPVRITGATLFENGTAEDLVLNARLKVDGALDENGVLLADKVSFRLARNVKVEAEVSAVDFAAGTVTVLGLSPGLTVKADASTELRDKRGHDRSFGLASLQVGDRVKIRASLRDGEVIAAKLERDDPRDDGRVRLQGPVEVDASGEPLVRILGIAVDTSSARFPPSFFAALGPGVLVKATGILSADGVIVAREVEIEAEHRMAHEAENAFAFEMESESDRR